MSPDLVVHVAKILGTKGLVQCESSLTSDHSFSVQKSSSVSWTVYPYIRHEAIFSPRSDVHITVQGQYVSLVLYWLGKARWGPTTLPGCKSQAKRLRLFLRPQFGL